MSLLKKVWRESASLIICGRNANNTIANGANYKILVMKRSSRASFMPNLIVFPGGAIEPADSHPDWLHSLHKLGVPEHRYERLQPDQQPRPFIFDHKHAIHGDAEPTAAIDRNISLRLSAIRETFEELGILLGRSATAPPKAADAGNHVGGEDAATRADQFAAAYALSDGKRWQKTVHADAEQFRALCTGQNIIPDLWSLFEWTDWLTPTEFLKKRFDTAFYLTTLANQPAVLAEPNEVQEYLWASPDELLRLYAARQIEFAPPQFYELCRLSHCADIDELQRFARRRQALGSTLFYPLCYHTSDGFVSVYPGDDLYPDEPDFVGDVHDSRRYERLTLAELRARSGRLHRMERSVVDSEAGAGRGMQSVQTVEPCNGHLSSLPRLKLRL